MPRKVFSLVLVAIFLLSSCVTAWAAPVIKTKTVEFEESAIQPHSKTINIPKLMDIKSVTTNTGNVTYSVNDENVTVNVSGGNYSRREQTGGSDADTKFVTNQPSANYNSGGYSGTLTKYLHSGSYTPADSKDVNVTVSSTISYYWFYDSTGTLTFEHSDAKITTSDSNFNITTGSYTYNSGGYTGLLTNWSIIDSVGYPFPTTPGWAPDLKVTYSISGTVTKPASDTRVYRYEGNVTKPDTRTYRYFYKYTATIKYTDNSDPEITIDSPSGTPIVSENDGYRIISGQVKDEDNDDIITVYYNVDNDTKEEIASLTASGSWQNFSTTVDLSSYNEGIRTLRVWAEDDKGGKSDIATQNFIVDKTGINITFTPDGNNVWKKSQDITITANSASGAGVGEVKYQLAPADTPPSLTLPLDSLWESIEPGSTLSLENLTGKYRLHVYAKDGVDNVTFTSSEIYMLDNRPTVVTFLPDEQNWTVDEILVRVSSVDEHSGHNRLRYQWSKSNEKPASWSPWVSDSEVDLTLSDEGEWYLHVETEDNLGNVEWVCAGPYRHFKVQPVTGFKVTGTSVNTISVSWDKVDNQVYKLWLVPDEGGEIGHTDWVNGSNFQFSDLGLTSNKKYVPYIVTTRNDVGDKSYNTPSVKVSNDEKAFTNGEGITRATFLSGDDFIEITLSTKSVNNASDTMYELKNDITGQETTVPHHSPVWKNTGLAKESHYAYSARVINKNNEPSYYARLIFVDGDPHTTVHDLDIGDENFDIPSPGDDDVIDFGDLNNWDPAEPVNFNPDDMQGKTVKIGGQYFYITRNQHETVTNIAPIEAKYYSYSETGFGYSDWKELDDGYLSETVYLNQPGYYNIHFKFKNYNIESSPVVKGYLADWVKPKIEAESKIKGQTATTDGKFVIVISAEDNIAHSYLFYSVDNGLTWYVLNNTTDVIFNNVPMSSSGVQNRLTLKVSDICGNVAEKTFTVWGVSK